MGKNNHHKNNFGQRISDRVAATVGSWKFILFQTLFFSTWIILNASGILTWDSHPFIFLTLLLGIQAAYTAPIILMSQNRTEERDQRKAEMDFQMDKKAEREIEEMQKQLNRIENKLEKNLNNPTNNQGA